ncbi:transposase [Streptomyces sp. NPDC051677]|uniref:transposase n=1 Tax=Streptomyces sp. NPDC051677 TaxID=3365669 RepID=UPI0037D6194A
MWEETAAGTGADHPDLDHGRCLTPPEHLCWKALHIVELLDLSAFENTYRDDGRGVVAYPPASLIALLLYCYSKGVRSSNRIEQACWDDMGCRIITANRRVDHSAVAQFARRHRAALNSLFVQVQVLALCGRRGLVDLSAVAVDGSPMEANASRDANQRLQRLGPPVPMVRKTVLVRQRTRLVKMGAWLERARTPRPVPSPESRACLSDPDSRLIPGKRGGYLQGYNIQIVCARRQFLLVIEAHDNPSDRTALVPRVKKTQHNHRAARLPGDIQLWLADSGYASDASFETLADLPLLVSVTSDADQAGLPAKRQQAPAGQQDMAARLATPTGRAQYRQRSALVEPGFAQIFQRFGRHLNYRGRHAVPRARHESLPRAHIAA